MYYIIYRTVHIATGKQYIGAHATDDLDDRYMGSGKILIRAIEKHGKAAFKTELIETCNSKGEMYVAEAKLVDAAFIKRDDTYNLKEGGTGGSVPGAKRIGHTEATKDKMSKAKKGILRGEYTQEHRNNIGDSPRGFEHSEESKANMTAAKIGKKHGKYKMRQPNT